MVRIDLALPKGITLRGGYLNIAFTFNGKRYRLNTIYTADTKHIKLVDRLLSNIKLDLERDQFYLSNFAKHFKQPEVLLELDANYVKAQDIKFINTLLTQQLEAYKASYIRGSLSLATIKGYTYVVDKYLIPLLGHIELTKLTINDIDLFLSKLNLSKKRIVIVLAPLRAIYKREFKLGNIKSNPFNQLDSTEVNQYAVISNYIVEPFNTQEKAAIINMAQGQLKNFIQFAFWTGMRIGEIFALTWDDINFKDETVSVTKTQSINSIIKAPKTKAGIRIIELTPLALDALYSQKQFTASCARVFLNPNTKKAWLQPDSFRRHWVKILDEAKIKYRNPHQMRHTFISHMLSLGNRPEILYKMVGHENTEMIYKVYGKFINENKIGKLLLT